MERDYLKKLGLEDDVIEKIMAQHGKDIEAAKKSEADAQKQIVAAKDTEIEGLKDQISKRDKDIKALQGSNADADAVKKQLEELQGKYKTDTDALNKKLKDQKEGFERQTATEKFFAGVDFSSELARKAAFAEFSEKAFKLEKDVFVGGKEWLEELRKNSPDAFKSKDNPDDNAGGSKPNFGGSVKNNQGGNGGGKADNPFGFNFTPIRKTE